MLKLMLASSIISVVVFIFLIFLSSFFIVNLQHKSRKCHLSDQGQPLPDIYEDEDGVASLESQKNHHVKFSKWLAISSSFVGLFTAILHVLFVENSRSGRGVQSLASWIFLADWV